MKGLPSDKGICHIAIIRGFAILSAMDSCHLDPLNYDIGVRVNLIPRLQLVSVHTLMAADIDIFTELAVAAKYRVFPTFVLFA